MSGLCIRFFLERKLVANNDPVVFMIHSIQVNTSYFLKATHAGCFLLVFFCLELC